MKKLIWWAVIIGVLCMMFGKDNVKNGANTIIDGVDKGSKIVADHVDTEGIKKDISKQVGNTGDFLGNLAEKIGK